MAKRSVTTDQLNPGDMFLIRGRITYSRVVTQIDGKELEDDIARERAHGRLNPVDKPYTKMAICQAQVESVTNGPNATMTRMYAEESFYQSMAANNPGANFRGINKSPTTPWIRQSLPTGQMLPIENPEGELATGLDVTLVMRIFGAKQRGQHNGVTLEGIIVHEPVRYFAGGSRGPSSDLAAFGYTEMTPEQIAQYQAQQQPFGSTAPQTPPPANSYQQPAQAPMPAPMENNFASNGQQTPYQPAQPAPAPAAPIPGYETAQGPVTPPPAQDQGVRYDPHAPRQY